MSALRVIRASGCCYYCKFRRDHRRPETYQLFPSLNVENNCLFRSISVNLVVVNNLNVYLFKDPYKLASRYDDNNSYQFSNHIFLSWRKNKLRNECVRAPKKAKGGRNLNWQVNRCGQLENSCVIYLTSMAGEF